MPVSRSFNKKKNGKKRVRVKLGALGEARLNEGRATATTSTRPPITVEVNGEEIMVDDELLMAMGGILRGDEVSVPSGNVKMSEVLIEFVEPFFELADESYRRALLSMAVTSWNGSLLAAAKRDDVKFDSVEGGRWLGELMAALIARKQEIYGDNNWMVKDYEIVGSGVEARIKVTATVLMPHLSK